MARISNHPNMEHYFVLSSLDSYTYYTIKYQSTRFDSHLSFKTFKECNQNTVYPPWYFLLLYIISFKAYAYYIHFSNNFDSTVDLHQKRKQNQKTKERYHYNVTDSIANSRKITFDALMHQGSELSFSKIRLPDAPVFRGSEFLKHQVHQGITRSNPRSLMHLRNSGGNTRISAWDKDTSELLRCT